MKKKTNAKLKKELWNVFSQYIRKRDRGVCFTCGRIATGLAYHAGHFIPKAVGGLALYFHEDNVHGQCFRCNINLGGNQYEYGIKLGVAKVAELYKLKNEITKDFPYEELIEKYKEKLKEL